MTTDTTTFLIGNGKSAKIGDKVWDTTHGRIRPCEIVRESRFGVVLVTGQYGMRRTTPTTLFHSYLEAVQCLLESRRIALDESRTKQSWLEAEIASLESMLAKESANARG